MNFEWSVEESIEEEYGAPGDRREVVERLGCESCMRGPAPCEHESECRAEAEAPTHDPGPSLCGERAISIDEWVLYHAPEE